MQHLASRKLENGFTENRTSPRPYPKELEAGDRLWPPSGGGRSGHFLPGLIFSSAHASAQEKQGDNMTTLKNLFQPIQIGRLAIKNRIAMAPMGTCLANENGAVTTSLVDYHVRRAIGGVGLIIVENASILPSRKICRLGLYDDHLVTGLRRLVEAVRESAPDTKIFVQVNQHFGRDVRLGSSASGLNYPGKSHSSINDLSIAEINYLKGKFVEGAARAARIGFDGIEVHGAHSYLVNQFLSPFYNSRTDEYGGSIEKNMRFAIEIIEGIRAEVGSTYPIVFRQNGSDFLEKGLSIDDACLIARGVSEAGVDAIHVSAGLPASAEWTGQPMGFDSGCLVPLAERIKAVVSVPVIAVGKINDPVLADRIIGTGRADMVAIGRGLLADPDFPLKAYEGRINEIRKCIACRSCLSDRIYKGFEVRCKVNPTVGREKTLQITPAKRLKKLLVVGGGPAGLEAAVVAKRRGHSVRVFESSERLGGQLLMAMIPPFKTEIKGFVEDLVKEVRRLDIPVYLNSSVTAELIEEEKPDVIILATGGRPQIPDVPGIDQRNVVTYADIFTRSNSFAPRKAVILGGAETGCECADFMSETYKECSIVITEMVDEVAPGMEPVHRKLILERLKKKGVTILTGTRLCKIEEQGALLNRNGKDEEIRADLIVIAAGVTKVNELEADLEKANLEFYKIGDCSQIGKIENAILSAWKVASVI